MKKIDFRGNGGLGKQICMTGVIKQLRNKYQDAEIHVSTSYPAVMEKLNFIDKFFMHGPSPYYYDLHKDFEILDVEPYKDLNYRQGKEHIIDVWCRQLGLEPPKEKRGYITLDSQEQAFAEKSLGDVKKQGRKIIAIQFQGGTSYYSAQDANDPMRIKHCRDLRQEVAQEVVNKLSQKGYIVLQIALPTEPQLQNCLSLDRNQVMNPRMIFAILSKCDGLIAIDSFSQHAWVAMGKDKAVVLWGGTNPTNLGYACNTNLTSANGKECRFLHCNRPDTFMGDVTGSGQPWTCPFDSKCMKFDAEEICQALYANVPMSVPTQNPDSPK